MHKSFAAVDEYLVWNVSNALMLL
ncbi:hypothetical protein BN873_360019 [Candidatus Competibacter denitrificans Run_A_D11]|uniref:Uncharacterized protein n=1 Tax=Candidatus Competibacter denitrificans Run_A_D11 TaxID=1400863 RepID=W6MAF8_9GAMM|nr:hypothetical protein BN873_360019 [Candidatus Competibacter denitrificans Run_A_D11]